MLDFIAYVRKPFEVEAVQLTEENMDEIFGLIGYGEAPKKRGDGSRFIPIDNKKIQNVYRAFPGWWITRMVGPSGEINYRAYAEKPFHDQFVERSEELPQPDVAETSVDEAEADVEVEPDVGTDDWIPAEPLESVAATSDDPA